MAEPRTWTLMARNDNPDSRSMGQMIQDSFLPMAERADANIAARQSPHSGASAPVDSPERQAEIARKQAEIQAKYEEIERQRLLNEKPRSIDPELQGYKLRSR
jgi:hypothetical protein